MIDIKHIKKLSLLPENTELDISLKINEIADAINKIVEWIDDQQNYQLEQKER